MKKLYITSMLSILSVTLVFGSVVLAQDSTNSESSETESSQVKSSDDENEVETESENESTSLRNLREQRIEAAKKAAEARAEALKEKAEEREAIKARFEGAKLQLCESRQERITNIMSNFSDRGTRHIEVFDTILQRVQAFYVEKNLSVDNYDSLVAEAAAKKAAAETLAAEVAATSVNFDCGGDNPLGVAESFKEQLKEMISALKEYRDAVRELISAVKTAAEATLSTEATDESN